MSAVVFAGIRKMLFAAANCLLNEIWKSSVGGLERLPISPFFITSGTVSAVGSQEESLM